MESVNVAKIDHRSFDQFNHGSHLNTPNGYSSRIKEQGGSCHGQLLALKKVIPSMIRRYRYILYLLVKVDGSTPEIEFIFFWL